MTQHRISIEEMLDELPPVERERLWWQIYQVLKIIEGMIARGEDKSVIKAYIASSQKWEEVQ
ncbi:hypothetical protein FJ434_16445 [Mesorhizobium sp. B2-5-13]|uniref:hypothetical protein n=1 Tax=unclassified Mesorhizobium TaxID=325217 RepID=UPI00112A8E34|nr:MULTISPECIES: hypothetical protein [unclassified Mesorhizobium]TPJ85514.1 hypothetical protein FJ434_16445 [Mesorhizobium sp. B2-5-13]TPK39274.1 hypothetical protein FJ560_29415 [Mesorhizobium sp. B2-5-5]